MSQPEIRTSLKRKYGPFIIPAALAAVLSANGCLGSPDDPFAYGVEEALIGGTVTGVRSEIGWWNQGCTATLVRPNWVLLAAHCWSNLDVRTASGWEFGSFETTNDGSTWTLRSASDRTFSFANLNPDAVVGPNDLMLVRLTTPVSSSVATPASISTSIPANGSAVTIFGIGQPNPALKQYVVSTQGASGSVIRNGDSGGPTLVGNVIAFPGLASSVYRVNSGFGTSDIFANAVAQRSGMIAVMDRWDAAAASDISNNSWCTHSTGELFYADMNNDRQPDAICHDRSTGWRWLARMQSRLIAQDNLATSTLNYCNHSGPSSTWEMQTAMDVTIRSVTT